MPKVTTVTHDCIEVFLSSLSEKGRASNTLKAYGTDLRVMISESGPIQAEHFEKVALVWINQYRTALSPKTTARRLTSIRVFAKWAQIPTHDLDEYSSPTAPRAVPHPLPEGMNGVRRMVDAANLSHHRAFIALCGFVGLRSSEALSVTSEHFDFHDMKLTVRGKGDVTRVVPVSPEAWDHLATPVVRSHGSSTVVGLHDRFARRLVSDLGERAGLQRRVASHDLRATFATAVYDKTKDMRLVQMLLGHASVTTTQLYVGIESNLLRDAVIL